MPTLIDRNGRRPDPWPAPSTAATEPAARASASGLPLPPAAPTEGRNHEPSRHRLLPLADWLEQRPALIAETAVAGGAAASRLKLGVVLGPADDPAAIADDLAALSLIAIDFPRFTDGRGYSIGRELRERYGWQGELRATGDILRDQLFYLARCGFDSFALRDDQNVDLALGAFRDFSEAYQAGVDRGPLFERRARPVPQRAAS